jgi:CRISPR-associated endonuclease/helicase Cas3
LANLAKNLPSLPKSWHQEDDFWIELLDEANDIGNDFTFEIADRPELKGLLLAVKAGLIASDSAASAIFRIHSYEKVTEWIESTLHTDSIAPAEIEEKILQPRYEQIEADTKKPFELKNFQKKAETLSSRLLLMSGCGSGKTIFAYKWMQGVLKNHQAGHVIFLYPTRGTATEGFKDYVSWCPEGEASLLTSTAKYELDAIARNPKESESTKDKDYQVDERLYALGFWGKRFFSATVDQFLSFLTHNYKSICMLPVLADSVVVIDEIHSFSPEMFDSLVCFLKTFDIPVLCMTATLPETRIQDLTVQLDRVKAGLGLEVFPTRDRSELEDLEKAEERERYFISKTKEDDALQLAVQAYQAGKRVLWVVNTVNRCREKAQALEKALKTEILVYHSRFKLEDRNDRHNAVVEAFDLNKNRGNKKAAIAVTTQVCEMSLDLDADVLITELAPISSLVQRFGRSNRGGDREYSEIYVYTPPNHKPYQQTKDLDPAESFLNDVLGRASQKLLAEKLREHSPQDRDADGSAPFVFQGYWATSKPFRNIDDYAVSAVLTDDLDEIAEEILQFNEELNQQAKQGNVDALKNKKSIDGYVVPVPKQYVLKDVPNRPDKLPKYLKIADSKFYCKKRGFGENA